MSRMFYVLFQGFINGKAFVFFIYVTLNCGVTTVHELLYLLFTCKIEAKAKAFYMNLFFKEISLSIFLLWLPVFSSVHCWWYCHLHWMASLLLCWYVYAKSLFLIQCVNLSSAGNGAMYLNTFLWFISWKVSFS